VAEVKRQRSNPRKPAFCCVGCQPWQKLNFQNFLAKLKTKRKKQLKDLSDLAACSLKMKKHFFLSLHSTVGAIWDVPACQYTGLQLCHLNLGFPDSGKVK